jgi:hypothetical protein
MATRDDRFLRHHKMKVSSKKNNSDDKLAEIMLANAKKRAETG